MQHTPRIITRHDVRAKMRSEGGLNARIALLLTKGVGTMWCAYVFAGLAIAGFPGLLGDQAMRLVSWVSQTFIQLTLLSVIMVGQAVLGRHAEMLSEEQYKTTEKTYTDIETVLKRLDAQDKEMLDMAGKISQVEQIEQVETLKQSDALEEILNLVREHDVLLKALPTSRGRAKA